MEQGILFDHYLRSEGKKVPALWEIKWMGQKGMGSIPHVEHCYLFNFLKACANCTENLPLR